MNQGYTYTEKLGADADGCTLLGYLSRRYRHSSTQAWRKRINAGRVRLDGAAAEAEAHLCRGQTLSWHRPPWDEPPAPAGFAVLYVDADLLAVAKPPGLPSMPGGGYLSHTLLYLVRRRCSEATPLHRLGRGTSGVALFALSECARRRMSRAWQEGEVTRVYRALVDGRPEQDLLDIRVPIGVVAHPLLGTVHAASPGGGKACCSRARVLERRRQSSVVEVRLETGRPHQIRIHMAWAGFPLVGDPLYPPGGVPGPETRALPGDLGYLLHAERLVFRHPASGSAVRIESIPPPLLRTGAAVATTA